jgi:hypothetical protein
MQSAAVSPPVSAPGVSTVPSASTATPSVSASLTVYGTGANGRVTQNIPASDLLVTDVKVMRLKDDGGEIVQGDTIALVATASFQYQPSSGTPTSGSLVSVGETVLRIVDTGDIDCVRPIGNPDISIWVNANFLFSFQLIDGPPNVNFRPTRLSWVQRLNTARIDSDFIEVDASAAMTPAAVTAPTTALAQTEPANITTGLPTTAPLVPSTGRPTLQEVMAGINILGQRILECQTAIQFAIQAAEQQAKAPVTDIEARVADEGTKTRERLDYAVGSVRDQVLALERTVEAIQHTLGAIHHTCNQTYEAQQVYASALIELPARLEAIEKRLKHHKNDG